MRTVLPLLPFVLLLGPTGCIEPPGVGPQAGALRENPPPTPPVDYKLIDMRAAVEEALQFGGLVTMAAAWRGHVGAIEQGQQTCPTFWTGAPPEDLVEIETDDEMPGMSWLANCATVPAGNVYDGFTWWNTTNDGTVGTRMLSADAVVTDANGNVLFDYLGEASDTLDTSSGGFNYSSGFAGVISGSLAGIGSGLRAQNNTAEADGGFEASWSSDGTLSFDGSVQAFDGFGPPDNRPADAPELEDQISWSPGIPRFTSARFQLSFDADCPNEPHGYIGLRGNEGFWFDVYFLPIYDVTEDTAQSNAYPYEQIDNVECDGVGTLFARNVDLEAADAEDGAWSREVAPDFAGVVASLPTPTLADYVFTLRHLPEN